MEETECVICMDRPARVLSLPCCHIVTCYRCWDKDTPCPICRADLLPRMLIVHDSIVKAVQPVIRELVCFLGGLGPVEAAVIVMELAKAVALNARAPIALPTRLLGPWTQLVRDAPRAVNDLCRTLDSPVPVFIGTREDTWATYPVTFVQTRDGVELWREFAPTCDRMVTLTVKTLTGKLFKLPPLSWLSPVEAIKNAIQDREGIPFDQQRISFCGVQLLDGHSIVSFFITDGATLDLVLRLSGC